MQITQKNLNRIMRIDDLSKRKAKLQEMALSIGWHGSVWQSAMEEIKRLNDLGIMTPLEKKYAEK